MTELSSLKLIKSPVGKISIGATQSGVAQIEILPPGSVRIEFSDSAKAHRFALDAADQLSEFFEGSRKGFSVPLDIAGTAFQLAVWTQIAKLDFGETKNLRRVGLSCRKSQGLSEQSVVPWARTPCRFWLVCHRILGSERRITGYSGGEGLVTKRWLLDFEQIEFKE